MMIESFGAVLLPLAMLAGALAILLYSADRLVGASEEVGVALGVPPFLIGVTILAVGTSLPELVTGIFAVFEGSGEIVVGTTIGSNIANILLILGFTAVYAKEISIDWDLLHGDLPVLFGSLMLMGFVIYPVSGADLDFFRGFDAQGADATRTMGARAHISVLEGVVLIGGYLLYIYYYMNFENPVLDNSGGAAADSRRIGVKPLLWIVAGLIGVPIGANFTVNAAVQLAELFAVSKEVVAASMISIGTSLPELVVSYNAAKRKNYAMALGNVTGSNIFNTFVVLGVPAILAPSVGKKVPLPVGDESILFLQMPYYVATVLVFLVIILDKKLTRTEGLIFLAAYVVFITKLYSLI
ncbi:MAG: calcium/sodium antiporter [SAR324 cluster bacterium]|nr:calcium/sodium antiporter [SAR324 cluster bacterium]